MSTHRSAGEVGGKLLFNWVSSEIPGLYLDVFVGRGFNVFIPAWKTLKTQSEAMKS